MISMTWLLMVCELMFVYILVDIIVPAKCEQMRVGGGGAR